MMDALEILLREQLLLLSGAAVLGLLVGSFLNVVIHRLPVMMEREWRIQCSEMTGGTGETEQQEPFNLIRPRSRCPSCGHPISALENIPLLSWLILRGRCSDCGSTISPRYPLVELTTGVLSAVVAWQLGATWEMFFNWSLMVSMMARLRSRILSIRGIRRFFIFLRIGVIS